MTVSKSKEVTCGSYVSGVNMSRCLSDCESDCASVETVCPEYQLQYNLYLSVVQTFGRDSVYNDLPDIDTDDDMSNTPKQYNITKLK